MSDDSRRSEFNNLDSSLETAVHAVLAETLPNDAVERVRNRALNLAALATPIHDYKSMAGNSKSRRSIVGGLVAAAIVAIAVGGPALLLDRSRSRAFAQMVEKVRAADTVQFDASYQFDQHISSGTLYRDGNRTRAEMGDGAFISITDIKSREVLTLFMKRKQYQRSRMSKWVAEQNVNPVDRLRQIKTDNARFVGEEKLNGQRMLVYRLDKADVLRMGRNDLETKLWIGFDSKLPTKIIVWDPHPKRQMKIQFDNFLWDESLDPKLFSLEVPDYFDVVVESPAQPVDASGKGHSNKAQQQ